MAETRKILVSFFEMIGSILEIGKPLDLLHSVSQKFYYKIDIYVF